MSMVGKTVLELPPAPGNPRNSEGAFLRLNDGRLFFAYSRFCGDSSSDSAEAQIAARYSFDEGETWSEDRVLFCAGDFEGAQNLMSVSFLRMRDRALGMFFLIRYSFLDTRLHLFRSYDEGETWSEPVCCVSEIGYFVTNNDRVLRLRSGRILVPANYHKYAGKSLENLGDDRCFTPLGTGFFFYSDDDGFSWRKSPETCVMPFSNSVSGLQETGLYQTDAGTVVSYFRTDMGYQYCSVSHDDGLTWSGVKPLRYFSSPRSPMKIFRLFSGTFLSVWNPVPEYTGRTLSPKGWGRSPLSLAVSYDGCKTWTDQKLIEDGESDKDAGFCYPAVFELSDSILTAYQAGGKDDPHCLARLRIKKIKKEEILKGEKHV